MKPELIVSIVSLVVSVLTFIAFAIRTSVFRNLIATSIERVLLAAKDKIQSHETRIGMDLARIAVSGVASLDVSDFDKRVMAVKAFQLLDSQDNGRRDFSDAKVRVLIDAAMEEKNGQR